MTNYKDPKNKTLRRKAQKPTALKYIYVKCVFKVHFAKPTYIRIVTTKIEYMTKKYNPCPIHQIYFR